jgi:hypothetical protein
MDIRTPYVALPVPPDRLFAFLADVENLPRWATEFCRRLKRVDGQYKVDSPTGEVSFRLEAHPATRVIDMFAGPAEDQMHCFPTRVLALPDGSSAYLFTMVGGSDEEHASLLREFDNLRRIFP